MMKMHIHARDMMFCVRAGSTDAHIVDEVVNKDVYGIWGVVKPHQIVIDIGAHIGAFSLFASALGATVYSYEPYSESFNLLCINKELNELKLHEENVAVFDKVGQTKLYIREENYGGNNVFGESVPDVPTQLVNTTTLDNILSENKLSFCDLLKLDCEGSEVEILKASSRLGNIKRIVLEAHGMERVEKVKKILQDTHKLVWTDEGDMPIMTFELR